MMNYPKKVDLGDITVRDGFQHEEKFIPTEAKLWLSEQLILAGYKKQVWNWEESNSEGVYFMLEEDSLEDIDFYITNDGYVADYKGRIWNSSNTGITYDQEIAFPYFGLKMSYLKDNITFQGHLVYSSFVNIDVVDHHLNRGMTIEAGLSDGEYFGAGFGMTWSLIPNFAISGSYEFEQIDPIKGDSKYTITMNQETGDDLPYPQVATYQNGHGAEYKSSSVMLNLVYTLDNERKQR